MELLGSYKSQKSLFDIIIGAYCYFMIAEYNAHEIALNVYVFEVMQNEPNLTFILLLRLN